MVPLGYILLTMNLVDYCVCSKIGFRKVFRSIVTAPLNPLFSLLSIGGGLGGTRRGGNDVNIRHSGREDGSGRRSRSRDNSEPRGFGSHRDRRHRSRSKERRRRRSRSRSKESRRRRRSRSKSGGERRRRRSRSRDRKRSRRSRSKSRDRTKRERRGDDGFRVKDEPRDGMVTNEYGYQVKQERTHDDPEDGMMDPDEQKPNVDNNGAAYEQY